MPAVLLAVVLGLLIAPVGAARADDLPGVGLTGTSGAPLRDGATYGVGMVIVAHFDARSVISARLNSS